MRRLYRCFILAVAASALVILLGGCAIGIKPRAYDVPPEDEVYYEESVSGPYYDTGFRSSGYGYSDSSYDPWTMGTYYQHYSGPPRPSASSGRSSASHTTIENKRPTVKDRNSSFANQLKAPVSSSDANSKRSRSSLRERRKTNSQISDSARRKVKRNVNREASTASQKGESTNDAHVKRKRPQVQKSPQKVQPKKVKSPAEEEEDEKNKKKRVSE